MLGAVDYWHRPRDVCAEYWVCNNYLKRFLDMSEVELNNYLSSGWR